MVSRARPKEELASVANCLCWHAARLVCVRALLRFVADRLTPLRFCCSDAYFLFVLESITPRAALRAPRDEQDAWRLLDTVQRRAAQQGADTGWQLPCPACTALVHGVSCQQAARDADLFAVLTVRQQGLQRCARTTKADG